MRSIEREGNEEESERRLKKRDVDVTEGRKWKHIFSPDWMRCRVWAKQFKNVQDKSEIRCRKVFHKNNNNIQRQQIFILNDASKRERENCSRLGCFPARFLWKIKKNKIRKRMFHMKKNNLKKFSKNHKEKML